MTLKIAGVATLLLPAADAAEPLRARLRELLPEPPRRVNRMTELALLGALRALGGRQPEARCPLYLALTHGNCADNVALVGNLAGHNVGPTPVGFINLSSNMAGFHVAATLGLHGSNQAIAAGELSFEAALELFALGAEHRSQGLVGAVEECAWPLAAHRQRLHLAPDRPLTECSHWLYVDQGAAQPLATLRWVRWYADAVAAQAALAQEHFPAGTLRQSVTDNPAAYTGHRAARAICGFVERGAAPGLVHVNDGASGCYAVYLTRP